MSANLYSQLVNALATELAGLSSYTGLEIFTMRFDSRNLPDFARYAIVLAPSARPWEERIIAVRSVQPILRVDVYALVKNFSESDSLFGTTSPNAGLFQFVADIKERLRMSSLGGLLDKTYAEAAGDATHGGGGPVEYGDSAAVGFDSGRHAFVQRARLPFVGRMQPFTHPTV